MKNKEVEEFVGITAYKSKTEGVGGLIKESPEDFIVEEIIPEGVVLEVDKNLFSDPGPSQQYLHFTLQKTNWETHRVMKELSNRVNVSRNRFGFAGTKDRRALTTQRASVWNTSAEDLAKATLKDVSLRDFVYSGGPVKLGDLQGNRFTVTIRGIDLDQGELESRVKSVTSELSSGFPNYYGLQRFGVQRPITHLVGKSILKKDFEEAVYIYLARVFSDEETDEDIARRNLAESRDVKQALKDFPRYLGYEASMLNHLAQKPGDYVGALRKLPKNLRIMFVHAYQSYLFNRMLSEILEKDYDGLHLPLIGFQSQLDDFSSRMLEEDGLSKESFRVRDMPELSSKGSSRDCFTQAVDTEVLKVSSGDQHSGRSKLTLRFKLPRGCYATILLREYMKG